MISYHVFFSPREGVDEAQMIAAAHQFLGERRTTGKLRDCRLLRVTNPASFAGLPRFQLIVDYASQQELDDSFAFMRAPGASHAGGHGQILKLVGDFKVSFMADA